MTERAELERLASAAARIRASAGLGRSRTLRRLFDYLLERTLRGDTPREVEIAGDVFGKAGSDLLVDASVRVYVHRLRKKLDDYYAGPGRDDAERLVLPRGDYRFALSSQEPEVSETVSAALPVPPSSRRFERWLFLLIGLIAGGALALAALHFSTDNDGLAEVRRSQVWAPLIASRRPLTIVPGDYYIMGERDRPSEEPARLVREFSVNSRGELDDLLMRKPELRDRYVDINLYYLPVSTAYALKTVMPILAPGLAGRRATAVVDSSKLQPSQFKTGDIVYVGLLSALGLLEQPVFANSRFGFGGSFDEIIDTDTGQVYVADPPRDEDSARRNYAYVAMLPGPNGNHILIIAGTRDPAVQQAIDILSAPAALKQLQDKVHSDYFEALYAVDGVGDENLKGTLIAAAPRSIEGLWNAMLDAPEAGTGSNP